MSSALLSSTRIARMATLVRRRRTDIGVLKPSNTSVTSSSWLSSSAISTAATNASNKVLPIKLHYEYLPAPQAKNERTDSTGISSNNIDEYNILFLHGLLGSGRNLKTFARNVVKQQSSALPTSTANSGVCRGGILMDIRGHGKSYQNQKQGTDQTVNDNVTKFLDCVRDIEYTLQNLSVQVVVGHSFGGRLTLEYAYEIVKQRQEQKQNAESSPQPLKAIWLLDTVPGQANDSVDKVLAIITDVLKNNSTKDVVPNKKEIVKVLTNPPYDMDLATAQWLATSYDDGQQKQYSDTSNGSSISNFGFDNDLVERLKPEFSNQDFMGMIRTILSSNVNNDDSNSSSYSSSAIHVHMVRGGKNKGWTLPILTELEELHREYRSTFHLHVLPKAGHNVHVDDLQGLVQLFQGT